MVRCKLRKIARKERGQSGVYVRALPVCLDLVVRNVLMFEEVRQPDKAADSCVSDVTASLPLPLSYLPFSYAATAKATALLRYRLKKNTIQERKEKNLINLGFICTVNRCARGGGWDGTQSAGLHGRKQHTCGPSQRVVQAGESSTEV